MPEVSASAFGFRQRVGAVDFHAVTSVSLEKIIEGNEFNELQLLLDTVTFSEFTEDDCRGQSIGALTKLIHVRLMRCLYYPYHSSPFFHSQCQIPNFFSPSCIDCATYHRVHANAQNAQLTTINSKSQEIKSFMKAARKLENDKIKLKEGLKSAESSMVCTYLLSLSTTFPLNPL